MSTYTLAFPSVLRFTPLNVLRTFTLRVHSFLLLFFFLFFISCQPAPNGPVPADETYIYSGSFRAIQEPFISVDGTEYPNLLGESPIQITAEVYNESLVFTIYGRAYGIYEVNFFVNHADCFEYNGSEIVDYAIDDFGNDVVRVVFPEDFWKRCYMDEDLEKVVSFVLKSEEPVFRI